MGFSVTKRTRGNRNKATIPSFLYKSKSKIPYVRGFAAPDFKQTLMRSIPKIIAVTPLI